MELAKVVEVGEEGGIELLTDSGGVIGAGVDEKGMVVAGEGLGEELAKVTEANDGDFEGRALHVLGVELGFIVEGLGGVDCADDVAEWTLVVAGFGGGKWEGK